MSNPSEQIHTEHLTVDLKHKPGCIIRIEIAVNPIATKAAYSKAIKNVNKEISIPGFRKGKAPESLVTQQFAKYVNQEWHDYLVKTAFHEFLNSSKLYPFTADRSIKKAEVKSASLENGAQLVIEYEAQPQIPEVNGQNLKLKTVKHHPVTDSEVEDTIRQIQLRHAEWNDVTDRSVKEGDFVDLTIDAIDHPPRNICTNMRFEVAPGKMGTWMRHLVMGHAIGDVVEGMSEKEDNASAEVQDEEEFKPTLCRITINSIKAAQPFPLNDELAVKVGLKTIDELRPRVEQDLKRRAEEEVQDQMRAQIEDQLLEQFPFDIPSSLIEKQRKELLDKRVEDLSRREADPQKMIGMIKEIEENINKELDRAYRLFFISRKIAEENNIQVFENEIINEMMRQLMLPPGQGIIDSSMHPDEARSKLYVNVLSQKVLDHLVSKAKAE